MTAENKLITFTVPCYNSAAYMSTCIESILSSNAKDIEIILVNDGSKDNTGEIADEYAEKYPDIIKAVHQENGGHGAAVMTGVHHACGKYFKVVDSDDRLDTDALKYALTVLRGLDEDIDVLVANYVYDKVGKKHKKSIRYTGTMPENRIFTWDETKHFKKGEYLLMHALIYRTQLILDSGLELPRHTFYVDNLYAYVPLSISEKLYYIDADLYYYFIGREDQSVKEEIMIKRIDQQLRVNRMMAEQVDLNTVREPKLRQYLYNYLEIITTVSCILITVSDTEENYKKRDELWEHLYSVDKDTADTLRHGIMGTFSNLSGKARPVAVAVYHLANKIFGFN